MKKPFYITTPIYYTSNNLHIGHSYSTVAADAMARYKRQRGYDVYFLTGTDEHGLKIQTRAQEEGVTPQAFVDAIVAKIQELWKLLNISYDGFIRTTDADHERRVQAIFQRLYDQGDIYKAEYEGWYCTPCEAFWTETQIKEGCCPDCGRPVVKTKEESYFFRLSKYTDRLIQLYEEHPEFVQPDSRANEMLNNFLRPGLQDLAVSRTSFDWGIPVPFDPKHVIYVWIDALSNYITALGWPDAENQMERFWPADVHLLGKEIVRFHALIWPALLMALDLPLPKQIYGHGWILFKEGKMSKSKGNVVDPVLLCARYGVDAIRYFLLREVPFGADGSYSNEALIQRINSDLANDLGNLLSRTLSMIVKYFEGTLPPPDARQTEAIDAELRAVAEEALREYEEHMDKMEFSLALAALWKLIGRGNKYIDETQPWILARDEAHKPRLAEVLANLGEVLRLVAIGLQPMMPETAEAMQTRLKLRESDFSYESRSEWRRFNPLDRLEPTDPLFPRLDLAKEIAYLETFLPPEAQAEEKAEQRQSVDASTPSAKQQKQGKSDKQVQTAKEPSQAAAQSAAKAGESGKNLDQAPEGVAYIQYEDFAKVQLRVGQIVRCERVEGANKLLREEVDLGTETRTIVSGIAPWYEPEDLVGKRVIVVTNLKPRKLRGVLSHGMLLAADTPDGGCRLLTVEEGVLPGAEVG